MSNREVTIDLEYYNELLKNEFESERIVQTLTKAEAEILYLKNKLDKIKTFTNENLYSNDKRLLINIIDEEDEI